MYKSEKTNEIYELIPDGVYEAEVESVTEKPTFDKTSELLEIRWRIPSINRVYFDNVNKDKKVPTDYNHWKISNILYATNCPDCSTTADIIKNLKGKKARITIISQLYDKTQKTYNHINDYDKIPTPAPAPASAPTTDTTGAIDVSTDNLPF